jgi:CheY-like chemotaxis protein
MPQRVLIVDDEEDARLMLAAVAAGEGLEVVEALDGREALDILERDADFALIICDKIMPRADGNEVMRYIRNDERLKETPVIMSTADRTTQALTGFPLDDKTHFVNKASGIDNMRRGIRRALSPDPDNKTTREIPTV